MKSVVETLVSVSATGKSVIGVECNLDVIGDKSWGRSRDIETVFVWGLPLFPIWNADASIEKQAIMAIHKRATDEFDIFLAACQ